MTFSFKLPVARILFSRFIYPCLLCQVFSSVPGGRSRLVLSCHSPRPPANPASTRIAVCSLLGLNHEDGCGNENPAMSIAPQRSSPRTSSRCLPALSPGCSPTPLTGWRQQCRVSSGQTPRSARGNARLQRAFSLFFFLFSFFLSLLIRNTIP